jgi:hypothetical protein
LQKKVGRRRSFGSLELIRVIEFCINDSSLPFKEGLSRQRRERQGEVYKKFDLTGF